MGPSDWNNKVRVPTCFNGIIIEYKIEYAKDDVVYCYDRVRAMKELVVKNALVYSRSIQVSPWHREEITPGGWLEEEYGWGD